MLDHKFKRRPSAERMNRGNTSFSAFPVHRHFRSVKNDPKERLKEVCFDEACSAGAIEPIRGELRRLLLRAGMSHEWTG